MKKRSLMSALLCSICLVASSTVPAMADGTKVVTLGADLSEAQKNTMLKYFKVNSSEVQILTVTNQDEREHLSGYVPAEQIGTRTVSCAYVRPTSSGGIKVRTANLNWVTCNMIASSLSTSGVKNCEVVAACPFEVSGTGALTGIEMAYEAASGQKLDPAKRDVATREMVVTSNLGERVGKKPATNVVNRSKIEVIENNITNHEEIYNIVVNNIEQNNITVNNSDVDELVALLEEIAQQNYNYEDMRETLENVDANVNDNAEPAAEGEEEPVSEDDGESIIDDVDVSAIGDDVIEGSTEDPELEEETGGEEAAAEAGDGEKTEDSWSEEQDPAAVPEGDDGTADEDGWTVFPGDESTETGDTTEIVETGEDGWTEDDYTETDSDTGEYVDPASTPSYGTGVALPEDDGWGYEESGDYTEYTDPAAASGEGSDMGMDGGDTYDASMEEIPAEESTGDAAAVQDTSMLNEQQKAQFEQAKQFCKGEYEGDAASLQAVMGSEAYASVTLDAATGQQVSALVEDTYLNVLKDGGMSYTPTGMEMYNSTELNMMNEKLKVIFGIESVSSTGLENISDMDKETLYYETLAFFEKLYGESMDNVGEYYEEEGYSEEAGEEIPEEY
ncbi:MAG: DUF1002 domain-containing protein [Blautia sp.]|nr:DUF1002 domain-containing protein [Blautia sp.]